MIALVGLVVLIGIAGFVPVPLVALSPGPTFNTLGSEHGKPVVSVTGRPTYPTSGHLDMTTVNVTDGLKAFYALGAWFDPHARVVPRVTVYPPGQSDARVRQLNNEMFSTSEQAAELAALRYLHEPTFTSVAGVQPDAAAKAVLAPGDVLLAIDGQQVNSANQVTQLVRKSRPGDKVAITYRRGSGPPTQGQVVLGSRPGGSGGFLGILVQDQPADPNQIQISLADVGGPSAGLMFTLAILDKITPIDLTGGRFIAGTGTIDPQGDVGAIDGIPFKMLAARDKGATAFLVPADNCKEAQESAPSGLTLIKVRTLTEAVNALNALKAGRPVPGCS